MIARLAELECIDFTEPLPVPVTGLPKEELEEKWTRFHEYSDRTSLEEEYDELIAKLLGLGTDRDRNDAQVAG